jgi:4-hydroxybenzoate decarboxylase subunit C
MNPAGFRTIGDFARYLESVGELVRVPVEVDPYLEITEIARRAIKERRPALLFERVKGSPYPVLVNALASDNRCELALHKHPGQIGEELIRFAEDMMPPKAGRLFAQRRFARRFLSTPVRRVQKGLSQQVVEQPDLDTLPVLTCWPEDGGRFVTLPQVVTYDPRTGKRNIGMYRMHVFDKATTGMHWQIQKGGGFHFVQAEKIGQPFELAVALGTDPALLLATVAPLPENIDEAMFAGFLRGRRTEFVRGRSIGIDVPAEAEFILEGVVRPGERRIEGPFGDHFGHYSLAAEFPVFHCSAITHKNNPIYPATVVGIPPMEDKFLGDTTQLILGPLARLLHAEIASLWAYYEAGFHNLLAVAVDQRYGKEAMKTALGLMGMSQLSLTKCMVLVSEGVNVRNFDEVMKEVRDHFDPHYDFVMIPRVPLDTLDFTSATMNLGSKMILDATRKPAPRVPVGRRGTLSAPSVQDAARNAHPAIIDVNLVHETILLAKVTGQGREVVRALVAHPGLGSVAIVAAVSEDVDLHDRENYIWGLFTRFDAERDVIFSHQELIGISPVYRGVMGIDATWKPGYPKPLRMTDEVVKRVDALWGRIWH